MTQVLYLTQSELVAEAVRRRYPSEIVQSAPLTLPMGRRGDVVVVQPLPPDATLREKERFAELLAQARTKVRSVGGPVILGELI